MQVQVGTLSPVTIGELVYFGSDESVGSATIGVIAAVVGTSVLSIIATLAVMMLCFRLKMEKAKVSKEIM